MYLRYIDDIWGVWTHSRSDFEDFVQTLNTHHTSIKLQATIHESTVNFLDTTTFKGPDFSNSGKLDTKVYFKPTDTHALLHKSSFHPKHTFKGLVYSQLLRFRRNCSLTQDLEQATKTLFQALKSRGYSRTFLRNIRKKAISHNDTTPPNTEENKTPIPLISIYSSYSVAAHRKLKQNFQDLLPEHILKESHRVISAFKKNPNLKDLLCRAKLPPMRPKNRIDHNPGPPVATNATRGTRFLTQPGLNLNSKNCIYLISCRTCKKQYVGETQNSLRTRLYAHRHNIQRGRKMDTLLVQHFRAHGLQNLKIKALESQSGWKDSHRRMAERRWISLLNTRHPEGLNDN